MIPINTATLLIGGIVLLFLLGLFITLYFYLTKKGKSLKELSPNNSSFSIDQGEEIKRGEDERSKQHKR